ncbi:MAG: four helix bundle protein [Saprospirales bacterium]|nr:four helix bundle protein [Saprospirales bacterium]
MGWYEYSFERLEAWKKAKELVKIIYILTEEFPKKEQFGIVQQIRRASLSIASNIAEGSARPSSKDRAHFMVMAYTSLLEMVNQAIIAHELGYMQDQDYEKVRMQSTEVSRMLNSLKNSYLGN